MARIAILSEFQYPYAVVTRPIATKIHNVPAERANTAHSPRITTHMIPNSPAVFRPLKCW
ncbi:hypothetical protein D3C74_342130 [compost metagenome]